MQHLVGGRGAVLRRSHARPLCGRGRATRSYMGRRRHRSEEGLHRDRRRGLAGEILHVQPQAPRPRLLAAHCDQGRQRPTFSSSTETIDCRRSCSVSRKALANGAAVARGEHLGLEGGPAAAGRGIRGGAAAGVADRDALGAAGLGRALGHADTSSSAGRLTQVRRLPGPASPHGRPTPAGG